MQRLGQREALAALAVLAMLLAGAQGGGSGSRPQATIADSGSRIVVAEWPRPSRLPVAVEFRRASDLRHFFERHRGAGDDPPTAYFLSQVLEECYGASRTLPMHRGETPGTVEDRGTRWQELAAAEALAAPCRGFENHPIEPAEVLGLLARSARAGDARARARILLFRDVAAPKEEVAEEVRALLATNDPVVVRDIGAFLSRGESHWRLAGTDVPAQVAVIAWELVACDLGFDCGATSPIVLSRCAHAGICGAGGYEDVLARTEAPERFRDAQALRAGLLQALRHHDWNWLGIG